MMYNVQLVTRSEYIYVCVCVGGELLSEEIS